MMRYGRSVPFVKATACGNDFLVVDEIPAAADLAGLSRKMCDRHLGVGADGVEWLFPDADPDVDAHARLFNADGSEAEISGNGTRCVAAYLCAKGLKQRIVIRTGAGLKTCVLTSQNQNEYEFEIAMGEPQVGEELSISLASRHVVTGICVSMGNPHYVIFVDQFSSDWKAEAAEISQQREFKHGINVEFVRLRNPDIDVRFFERGVGETQSSGTGSCAAAVAAIFSKKAKSPVRVHAAGGTQVVRWENEVFLTGPAQLICQGEFFA